ncbi:MAG: hypothetical protein ABID38_06130 [Candidatus Diapherotrites archaeon]
MLKKFSFVVFVFLLAISVQASIQLVAPVEGIMEANSTVDLGKVQPGETIILRISTSSGSEERWEQAIVKKDSLPDNWIAKDSAEGEKTIAVEISVPKNARQELYNFSVELSNPRARITPEKINLRVLVEEGLISSSVSSNTLTTDVGNEASFQIILVNDSVASHRVRISSPLPESWFSAEEIELMPKETAKIELGVTPQVYGAKGFRFSVTSLENGKNLGDFEMQIRARPSLPGKFSAANEGLPFFTFSLLPQYLINALLSLLIS